MSTVTITQTDIENVYGANYVAQWSSFDQGNNAVVNPTRITKAISLGQTWVNNRLAQSPYLTPISANDDNNPPADIVDAMATLAGWWLFKTRGLNYSKDTLKWMTDNYDRIMGQKGLLIQIRTGMWPIDAVLNTQRRQTPRVGCW